MAESATGKCRDFVENAEITFRGARPLLRCYETLMHCFKLRIVIVCILGIGLISFSMKSHANQKSRAVPNEIIVKFKGDGESASFDTKVEGIVERVRVKNSLGKVEHSRVFERTLRISKSSVAGPAKQAKAKSILRRTKMANIVRLKMTSGSIDATLRDLRNDPNVLYAERNVEYRAFNVPDDPVFRICGRSMAQKELRALTHLWRGPKLKATQTSLSQ